MRDDWVLNAEGVVSNTFLTMPSILESGIVLFGQRVDRVSHVKGRK